MAGRGVDIKLGGSAEHRTRQELAKLGLQPGDPDYDERFAEVLPAIEARVEEDREKVLEALRAHIRSVAKLQSGTSGLWHQMLDKTDSYLETSASAIFVYSIARAINRGWISPVSYGSVAQAGWMGLTTRVNARGQVEGTCVGTGMGFEPAFYYHRPTSPFAAHGYGPVLLAGAEVVRMLKTWRFEINDSSTQLYK